MFTKFAKLDVLEVKSAPVRQRTASLAKFADYNEYRTDDGYIYVRVRAISSRVNKNHDGWPAEELKKSYATFVGKPIFVDHHNTDPKKARGVIVDAVLHYDDQKTAALDPYYASAPSNHLPPTWIELLLEVDAKRFPKLAKAIIDGDIDGVSMGANVERSICSHCKNEARNPEQYCKHVRSKGAHFDYVDVKTGHKTSKKSYEDCYDIGFFELSFVFDPADDTALRFGDVIAKTKAKIAAAVNAEGAKTAERNAPPQSDMQTAPDKVDTLRQDQICPICGSDMEDGVCEVCNYEEPPEGFDNPDLEKAKQVDQEMREQDAQQAAQGMGNNAPNDLELNQVPNQGPQAMPGGAMPMAASTAKGSGTDAVTSEKTSAANGGRINTQERPILPVTRPSSDKPKSPKTISDSATPVVSTTRKENMSTKKTADGATADGGADVQPDKRVDVEGVGGVTGDPLSGIQHENVEKSMEQKGGPATDTWSGNEGDSLGQHEPVTTETGDLFTVSRERTADASNDVGGPIGEPVGQGTSDKGGPTWDSSDAGFPDHQPSRVDLLAPLKEEVGEGTKTFPSDGFHVGDPVTSEGVNDNVGGPIGTGINAPMKEHHPSVEAAVFARTVKAMKLAEAEVELGIHPNKWDRLAELEDKSEPELDIALELVSRARQAGLKKVASAPTSRTASSIPSLRPMQHIASGFDPAEHGVDEVNVEDSFY